MTELYFLRHGERIDHALQDDPNAKPILEDYKDYDPSLSTSAIPQLQKVVDDICSLTHAFTDTQSTQRKNVFVHFSPYLRCCQSADILISEMKSSFLEKFPNYKVRFQLLGDFALSEWIHDKMKNKPPFVDSDDAYNMYTPNLKSLKNKNACSNFRPTITLGPYNGPDLSYKDYQGRCKDYFKKLLATYDKPAYIKNKDIIVVVSHGYAINNFITYFINHPLFEEIPEAEANFALRVLKDETGEPEDVNDPANYTWRLVQDALHLIHEEEVDTTLNLETDIVYYKTNFIKKDEMETPKQLVPQESKPRPSFKIQETSSSNEGGRVPPSVRGNYICPAAKDWVPNAKHFLIKADFKEKVMNDESFRKQFKITNHPSRPISPEVSPNSAPTRTNSVIDLSKILSNEDIQPMKLKYSNTSEISIHKINSRMNSQVNLASFGNNHNSNENSTTDLPKYIASLQNRSRSSSNPLMNVAVAHNAKDSYFPSNIVGRIRSPDSDMSIDSNGELDIIEEVNDSQFNETLGRNSPIDSVQRARSLNKRRVNNPLFAQRKSQSSLFQNSFTKINNDPMQKSASEGRSTRKENESDDDDDDSDHGRLFSLNFNSSASKNPQSDKPTSHTYTNRPRKNSFKFYTSGASNNDENKGTASKPRPVFYNFDSSGDDDDDTDDESQFYTPNKVDNKSDTDYFWFGQNK
ncbi:hypothetical protein SBY92_004976 [Candida maltosa Xu316]